MNYLKHYEILIEKARKRNLKEYTESHHIWPKCIGGHDKPWNLVALTPEEHYVAHQLLIKIFPNETGLIWAAYNMTFGGIKQHRQNNKLYGWLKRYHMNIAKSRTGKQNGSFGRSWFYNPETLENKKIYPEQAPKGWIKGRILNKEIKVCKGCSKQLGLKSKTRRTYCDSCLQERKKEKALKHLPKEAHNKRKVVLEGIEFDSLTQASEYFNVSVETIRYRANGNKRS